MALETRSTTPASLRLMELIEMTKKLKNDKVDAGVVSLPRVKIFNLVQS